MEVVQTHQTIEHFGRSIAWLWNHSLIIHMDFIATFGWEMSELQKVSYCLEFRNDSLNKCAAHTIFKFSVHWLEMILFIGHD